MSAFAHLREPGLTEAECLAVARRLSSMTGTLNGMTFNDRVALVGRIRRLALDILDEGVTDHEEVLRQVVLRLPEARPIIDKLIDAVWAKLARAELRLLWECWFPADAK